MLKLVIDVLNCKLREWWMDVMDVRLRTYTIKIV